MSGARIVRPWRSAKALYRPAQPRGARERSTRACAMCVRVRVRVCSYSIAGVCIALSPTAVTPEVLKAVLLATDWLRNQKNCV
jgi:hypothetical protein